MNKLLFKLQTIEIEVLNMKRNFDKFLDYQYISSPELST